MGNEQKKIVKKFCLYIQNGGDDIQKWVNLSNFWKILALGFTLCMDSACYNKMLQCNVIVMYFVCHSTWGHDIKLWAMAWSMDQMSRHPVQCPYLTPQSQDFPKTAQIGPFLDVITSVLDVYYTSNVIVFNSRIMPLFLLRCSVIFSSTIIDFQLKKYQITYKRTVRLNFHCKWESPL